jgi:hypothetical protein
MHDIRIPPDIVSMRIVHRGTIMPIPPDGIAIGELIAIPPIPGIPIMPASIMVFIIIVAPRRNRGMPDSLHGTYRQPRRGRRYDDGAELGRDIELVTTPQIDASSRAITA